MSNKFQEYKQLDLSQVNKDVLKRWENDDTFHKSISSREGNPTFVFYEGPPSANGMPGIHHVMARAIKDIFCRYKTMKGFRVHRKAGWDTHGLPVELSVEKALNITKEDIGKKISVEKYNQSCRTEVMKYTREWEELTRIMGYWVNMDDPYVTFDNRYIESVWWILKKIYDKGLMYKGYTIQHNLKLSETKNQSFFLKELIPMFIFLHGQLLRGHYLRTPHFALVPVLNM